MHMKDFIISYLCPHELENMKRRLYSFIEVINQHKLAYSEYLILNGHHELFDEYEYELDDSDESEDESIIAAA
jgi:hypothetical protein